MNLRFTPAAMLFGLATFGLAVVFTAVYLATDRPWLGIKLVTERAKGIHVVAVRNDGPSYDRVVKGRLVSVRGPDGAGIASEADDLLEEPDTVSTYALMNRFFARQTEMDRILHQGGVRIRTVDQNGINHDAVVTPRALRPVGDFPAAFWVQLFVGLASFVIGAWVWSLRRKDPATALFALASFGILLSTFPAALYSTREMAIDGVLFRCLSVINHSGAMLFAAAMISLLLSYPKPLTSTILRYLPFAVLGSWWLADSFQLFGGPSTGIHLPIMLAMALITALAILQYRRALGDPRARAVMRWFGSSITIGAGAFALTTIAPNLIGLTPVLPQGYAFIFFLLIHVGIALGVARYRLFDLDRWAFKILFYITGAALLLLVDAMLISWIAIGRVPAFGLALALIVLFYLPLRDTIARGLSGRREPEREVWFSHIIEVALSPSERDRQQRWHALLTSAFQPLRIVAGQEVEAPALLAEGAALAIPAVGPLPAQRLEHAMHGRRLFSPRDQARVVELCAILAHAMTSRIAYEQGASEERGRITRDMHDNIGVQLLGALHSRDTIRKDEMIRDTLVDLREIINNSAGQGLTLGDLMADLRVELADILSNVGIALAWEMDLIADFPPKGIPAIRSILREAVGNALRHAQASTVFVSLVRESGGVVLTVEDDGCGFVPENIVPGNGLDNMRARVASLAGDVTIEPAAPGTRVVVRIPLESGSCNAS